MQYISFDAHKHYTIASVERHTVRLGRNRVEGPEARPQDGAAPVAPPDGVHEMGFDAAPTS